MRKAFIPYSKALYGAERPALSERNLEINYLGSLGGGPKLKFLMLFWNPWKTIFYSKKHGTPNTFSKRDMQFIFGHCDTLLGEVSVHTFAYFLIG